MIARQDWLSQVKSRMLTDINYVTVRVESGSDDPDNLGYLGHFFGGSSGSHPQTKLSGCDPDITCSLENMQCWHPCSK